MRRELAKTAATNTPPTTASSSAPAVILMVNHIEGNSEGRSVQRVWATSDGAGRM